MMDPIIETYVDEIVRHLPRARRNDVGLELRSLLSEEQDAKARAAGGKADAAMTIAMLQDFGAPQDVAMRYGARGFTIIRPLDAPMFAGLAIGGVVFQWALALADIFVGHTHGPVWFIGWGLGAFWWPGLLVTIQLVAAWLRNRNDEGANWMSIRTLDRDRINRPLIAMALGFWIVGAAILIALPWFGQIFSNAPKPLIAAFAFDQTFLLWRAPWVLPMWAASFGVYMAVLAAGRWTQQTRRFETVLSGVWALLLGWFVLGGRIFVQQQAESTVKLALALLVILSLGTVMANVMRARRRVSDPHQLGAATHS